MKNKGFSLVELIVVIAIMAILVGVAVPVYTSYIGKANEAKDAQLLGEINSAFMVACVDNNVDFDDITPENNVITITNGVVSFDDMYDDIVDTMKTILPGELKFKTITALYYNPTTREFATAVVLSYGGGIIVMNPEDIAKLKDSEFGKIGMEKLMEKVDLATYIASIASEGSDLNALITNEANKRNLAACLGLEYSEDRKSDFQKAYRNLIYAKMELMTDEDIDSMETEAFDALYANAESQILANNAVLSAATNTTFDADAFAGQLQAGNAIDAIKDAETEEQLALTAMAYAMYASYVSNTTNGNADAITNDVSTVLATLETDEFKAYMAQPEAQADVQGYLAAMNMVNQSADDKNAVSTLLVNGFTDPDLVNQLQGAVGN